MSTTKADIRETGGGILGSRPAVRSRYWLYATVVTVVVGAGVGLGVGIANASQKDAKYKSVNDAMIGLFTKFGGGDLPGILEHYRDDAVVFFTRNGVMQVFTKDTLPEMFGANHFTVLGAEKGELKPSAKVSTCEPQGTATMQSTMVSPISGNIAVADTFVWDESFYLKFVNIVWVSVSDVTPQEGFSGNYE